MCQLRLTLILFLALIEGLNAQETGGGKEEQRSPDTASVHYYHASQRWQGSELKSAIDTLLTGFNFYDPLEGFDRIYAVNGNIGLAYKNLIFGHTVQPGFRFTPFYFSNYFLLNENIPYYRTFAPYSNVAYSFGNGKEQLFNVTHSQQVMRGLSLGIDLRIINSLGLYTRQKSDNVSVALQSQYISGSERYAVLANYHSNRLRWRENGGIVYDTVFTDNQEPDRQRIAVRLSNAENLIKENGFQVSQYYYFFRKNGRIGNDTLTDIEQGEADTMKIASRENPLYFDPGRTNFIRHTFTYSRNASLYTDKNPKGGYYPAIYADSTKTFDSLFFHEFTNEFAVEGGIGRARGSEKAIVVRGGIEHTFTTFKYDTTVKKQFNRLTTFGYISANAFGVARAEGKIWMTNGAPFKGDKGITAMLTLPAFDNSASWGNLHASLSLDALQPDYFFQYYQSNHFRWENSFGQQTILGGKVMYSRKHLKAGFNFYNLEGWVYLDENALPTRENAAFQVTQLYGQADIGLGPFGLHAYAVWQNSANAEAIRVPDLAARFSATYTVALFKRALHLQTGLSAMYNTAFMADAYMPALRSYYLQNTVETGGYPYVDAFINLRVKRARMFLVMEHVNAGLNGYNYFMVPHYPMADRGFRFGVSWNFFD